MSDPRQQAAQPMHLRIEKPVYGGAGLARENGKAVFVPYTLPGEFVAATVTKERSGFAEAALNEVLEASSERIAPACPYFGVCGGCHYQHAQYPAQLAMKVAILEETLSRAHLVDLPSIVTHSGAPFGYRNRVRLHLDPATSALGYRERGSHRLLPVSVCPIAASAIEQSLAPVAEVCARHESGQIFSQIELSTNHDGSELQLALWLRSRARQEEAARRLKQLCEALKALLPALSGAGVHAAPVEEGRSRQTGSQRKPRTKQQNHPDDEPGALIARWGTSHVTYRVSSLDYRVSLGAFFQVNRTLLPALVELATEGRSGRLAWDLYAGVGLFSRVLAQHFDQVIAVEGSPISSRDLDFHLAAPHKAMRSSTLAFLRVAASKSPTTHTPDFVLVDPPRAGLGEEVCKFLAQIRPAHITYVSCDPATLSRDLRALVDSGYQLRQLHLIDLFPQTFHLEAVAMLSLA